MSGLLDALAGAWVAASALFSHPFPIFLAVALIVGTYLGSGTAGGSRRREEARRDRRV